MPRLLLVLIALLTATWLAGCATLSKSECEAGNWRAIGVADGAHGTPVSRFDLHLKACAHFDIVPDKTLYLAGRDEGLISYCHLDRASKDGILGKINYKVCSGELGASFNRVYAQAREVYKAREAADEIRSKINDVMGDMASAPDAQSRSSLWRDGLDLSDDLHAQQDVIARSQDTLHAILDEERQRLAALGIKD